MGTSKLLWRQPDKMLGGNLRWTGIPSRGDRNAPSDFIQQKPEISAVTDEPSGSPNYDWEQTLLYTFLARSLFVCESIDYKSDVTEKCRKVLNIETTFLWSKRVKTRVKRHPSECKNICCGLKKVVAQSRARVNFEQQILLLVFHQTLNLSRNKFVVIHTKQMNQSACCISSTYNKCFCCVTS